MDSIIPVAVLRVVKVPFDLTAEKLSVVFLSEPYIIVYSFFSSFLIKKKKKTFFRGGEGWGSFNHIISFIKITPQR